MGVPAVVVSHKGSFTQVTYRGMTEDPGRSAAQLVAHGDALPRQNARPGA
jgi:hypothetical protein